MTATRIGLLATVVVFAAGWLVAAALLWRTSVPSGVDVGGLDASRFFSAHELARAARYQRLLDVVWLLSIVAKLAVLAILARRGPRLARSIGLGRVGTGVIVGSVVATTVWAVGLPFELAARWWAARHDLAPGVPAAWLPAQLSSLAADAVAALAAVSLVLWLAGRLGERWWLVGVPLAGLFSAASLFLFGFAAELGTHAPRRAALRADIPRLERIENVDGTPVRVNDVGDVTPANAVTNGFGPSANVVLWSTLLDGRFTRGEIRVVVAHELGHVAHRHVLKTVGWTALVALPLAWLLTLAARLRGGIADPGALPFVLLVLAVVGLLSAPLANAVSRRYEAEADWSALQATRDPAAARKLFVDVARTSLQQPNPPTWDYLWLKDHPTIAQRIAMIDAWASCSSQRRC